MAKQYFKMLNLDHQEKEVDNALGIPPERSKALKKELLYMREESGITIVSQELEYILEYCESIEEVVYASYLIGTKRCSPSIRPIPLSPEELPKDFLKFLDDKLKGLFGDDD